jgi:hypothetical protein
MLEQDRKFASCFCFVMVVVCMLSAFAFWTYIDSFAIAAFVSGSFVLAALAITTGYSMLYTTEELINDEHEDNAV